MRSFPFGMNDDDTPQDPSYRTCPGQSCVVGFVLKAVLATYVAYSKGVVFDGPSDILHVSHSSRVRRYRKVDLWHASYYVPAVRKIFSVALSSSESGCLVFRLSTNQGMI